MDNKGGHFDTTQDGATNQGSQGQPFSQAPSIQLPKGGGAIRGIGEKFAANPVTGTGSLTVPIATSPGRSGFGPQLSLSYDSGSGNGPFGLGWSLSLPSITRKTDKGLPRYRDAEESDAFILSGAEDLVPVLIKDQNDNWVREELPSREQSGETYSIQRYRPRVEGLFARIECWRNVDDPTDVKWRSISKDNVTTWYGKDEWSRIVDPNDCKHIFSWLVSESYDDKGNAIVYEYVKEDSANLNTQDYLEKAICHEKNRTDKSRSAARYLKRIKYGNTESRLNQADLSAQQWLFEVVFDYEEGHYTPRLPDAEDRQFVKVDIADQLDENNRRLWPPRSDPFSSYRAGFEVRTYRRCQRVLMIHHFHNELGVTDSLVRSTEFQYNTGPIASFITRVIQSGYKHRGNNIYYKKSLPPVEFEYTRAHIQHELKVVNSQSMENLPQGIDGSLYQWADLDGEGAGGILTEQAGAWYYKRNLSPLTLGHEPQQPEPAVQFGPLEAISPLPDFTGIARGQHQILDLAGDGQVDVVSHDQPLPGFYERTTEGDWKPFKAFASIPNISLRDANVKLVDLTGDGHADILFTEEQAFSWYASLAEQGFAPAQRTQQVLDEEKGPRLVFADGTDTLYISDMSGDGLGDLVRIRNGQVCYWPNLGYCRFGAKVTMDNAPRFDAPDSFDQKRIRLADIDGSGVTDILYVKHDQVDVYLNQSGNRWTDPRPITHLPAIDNTSTVQTMDLMGNGTACLVWSSPLPGNTRSPMRYIDLTGGQKPHLLTKVTNNLGAETRIHYAPSTKFYLMDKQQGKEWITRLHFPVQVVEKVETYDYLSRNRFVTRYAYHHGYFDGHEREFRGFAMVEQWDTEEFASLSQSGEFPTGENIKQASHIPPVHTKTWFHTGVYLRRHHVSNFFAGLLNEHDTGEYFREPGLDDDRASALLLPDTVLADEILPEEEREACRALKGQMLRQEVYALDGTDKEEFPYTVTEQNFTIKRLQPKQDNPHAVFFTHAREVLNYHYERNPADPRISHGLTLQVDDYGNALKSVAVGYGRRPGNSPLSGDDRRKQEQRLITYTENEVTNAIDDPVHDPDNYRSPLPRQVSTYELTGLEPTNDASRFSYVELVENDFARICGLAGVPYEQAVDYTAERKRLVERVRTVYRSNDLTQCLINKPYLESRALPCETYKLAFTPGLIDQVYIRDEQALIGDIPNLLGGTGSDQGGYVELDNDGHWWIPSGRSYFSEGADIDDPALTASDELTEAENHFFLPRKYADPFHHCTFVRYDAHDLLLLQSRDTLGNTTTVGLRNENGNLEAQGNNYRLLQAEVVMGPNRNVTRVAFDALGLVVGTAVMGKPEDIPSQGDILDNSFTSEPTHQQVTDFFANPRGDPVYALLAKVTRRIVYDVDRFYRTSKANPENKEQWLPGFAATITRETHTCDLPDPQSRDFESQVSFSYFDGLGREIQKKIQAEKGKIVKDGPEVEPRWVGSGWTIFNNKGKPVRQYEPFFTDTHDVEFEGKEGVSPILFYDPVGRVVATIHPNHCYEKVRFDPWHQTTFDVNDTINFAPQADRDIKPYLRNPDDTPRLPEADYLPTWYQLRTDAANRVEFEKQYPDQTDRQHQAEAANKAVAHADTPTTVHMDALGRPFLTVAHNRVVCPGHALDGSEDFLQTRVELDIEGNQRQVRDADTRAWNENGVEEMDKRGRIVMQYAYCAVGPEQQEEGASNRIHQLSMEAGARWTLNDVTGNPIRTWDSRGHTFRTEYDSLRRPLRSWVLGIGQNEPSHEFLTERLIYGEQHPQASQLNLLGKLYMHFDQAGVVTSDALDFKGNPLRATRRLASVYKRTISWQTINAILPADSGSPINLAGLETALAPLLETDTYTSATTYDALNRPLTTTSPDGSIYRPGYNEANLLERVDVNLRGAAKTTPFVINIDYDAKGQRRSIEYGCGATGNPRGVTTRYDYDPLTFRLVRMETRRPPNLNGLASQLFHNPQLVQELHYTYDPAGNITHIVDNALQRLVHNGQIVEPQCRYDYDAIYRLLKATGREHIGQSAVMPNPPNGHLRDYPYTGAHNLGDPQALQNYTQFYEYDATGNFNTMRHQAGNSSWTRSYEYNETSLVESNKKSNRLSSAPLQGELPISNQQFTYDAHGNMTRMPHLRLMQWDDKDQLQATAQQLVNNGIAETTWYVYDASGQRVRKVTESMVTEQGIANDDTPYRMKQRVYLGGFEIYREYENDGDTPKLERESLHVMDDKQRIAVLETKTIDTNDPAELNRPLQRYQLSNHLGSSALELTEDAELISYEEYRPYGTSGFQAGRSGAETSLKRYRYSGKERDEENGFYYYGARYYASWLGRWCSSDPLGLVDGNNLFKYVRNNPIVLIDEDGRSSGTNRRIQMDPALVVGEANSSAYPVPPNREDYDFDDKDPNSQFGIDAWKRDSKEWVRKLAKQQSENVTETTISAGIVVGVTGVIALGGVGGALLVKGGIGVVAAGSLESAPIITGALIGAGGGLGAEGTHLLLSEYMTDGKDILTGEEISSEDVVYRLLFAGAAGGALGALHGALVRGLPKSSSAKLSAELKKGLPIDEARAMAVAELEGGRLAQVETSKGTFRDAPAVYDYKETGIDVWGRKGEFIAVGGQGKAGNNANFIKQLRNLIVLQRAARTQGTVAKAYFDISEGITERYAKLISTSIDILGKENVKLFTLK